MGLSNSWLLASHGQKGTELEAAEDHVCRSGWLRQWTFCGPAWFVLVNKRG